MPKLPTGFDQHIVEPAGLDLASDPLDSECLEALNVTFADNGRIKPRPGYRTIKTAITGNRSNIVAFDYNYDAHFLFRQSDTQWRAIKSDGTTVATYSIAASDAPLVMSAARVSTPTSAAIYVACATSGNNYGIRKYDGSAFSAPAGTGPTIPPDPNLAQISGYTDTGTSATSKVPACAFVAVTPWGSNRLVAGRVYAPSSEAGNSRVMFSAKGKPETWQVNHYVDLNPGDGEHIQAMVTWRDKLFVFKRSTFYVFYGEHSDEDGNPVFDYTTYSNRAPMRSFDAGGDGSIGKAVAGRDGVYYIGADGIYRTTGQDPVKVSGQLDTIFDGSRPIAETASYIGAWLDADGTGLRLGHYGNHLLFAVPFDGTLYAFVMHEPSRKWSRWQLLPDDHVFSGLTAYNDPNAVDGESLAFLTLQVLSSSSCVVGVMRNTGFAYEDDQDAGGGNGDAFHVEYHTGLLDLGTPDEKVVREVMVDASVPDSLLVDSSVRVAVASNLDTSPATAELLEFQTSVSNPIGDMTYPQQLRHRRSYKGRWFQVRLTEMACELHRLIVSVGSVSGPTSDET